ncbi:hypothetical protein FB446DRAFT_830345 [Lentinula raphanica]|nr:hypothetical protein FB446DRAFT_830345 [Lentinula raphanica]
MLSQEMKFCLLTKHNALTEIPIKPITAGEITKQVEELASQVDSNPTSEHIHMPYSPHVPKLETAPLETMSQVDPEKICETFMFMLGYYLPKGPELRVQQGIPFEGCKDWTVQACGLKMPLFVSEEFNVLPGGILIGIGIEIQRVVSTGLVIRITGIESQRVVLTGLKARGVLIGLMRGASLGLVAMELVIIPGIGSRTTMKITTKEGVIVRTLSGTDIEGMMTVVVVI